MEIAKFLSNATYLVLPAPSRPKVYLCIDTGSVAKTSFELYNPFSLKARILKIIARFLSIHCNAIIKKIVPTIEGKKSDFIQFLENGLSRHLITSAYIATANDKLVLQLQNDSNVIGYLKYPLSALGEKRLTNERNAITILSQKGIVPELIQKDTFDGRPYIIVKNLQGTIGQLQNEEYQSILNRLRKDKKFKLAKHPRIRQLTQMLTALDRPDLLHILKTTTQSSHHQYFEVFEHGDFAPWNLIQTEGHAVPFDFEYFEENGLEYLDEIKYHFQSQHLLAGKKGSGLVKAVLAKLNFSEAPLLFRVFLLKEIANKLATDDPHDFEQSLLHLISEKEMPINEKSRN